MAAAIRVFTYNPGLIAGHTVYRRTRQVLQTQYEYVGTRVVEEDVGTSYPRRIIEPIYEEREVLVTVESWVVVPNAMVPAYEAGLENGKK